MEKSKAVYLVKYGKADEAFLVREVDKPQPGPRQVLIKSEVFGLNFAEIPMRYGMYKEAPPLPFVPGYDMVGRIEAVGEEVDSSWVGKRVSAMARFGTYAEYCVTDLAGIGEIPENLDAAKASAIAVQYVTAYYAAIFSMNLMPGDRVLIHAAAGGVGSALIQLCKWKGCEVIASVGSDEKRERALSLGADFAINYKKEDYFKACRKILDGKRLDATFNAVAGSTFKKDLKLLGSGGRLALFGAAERMGMKGGKWATLQFLWRMGLVMPILLMAKSRTIIGINILKVGDHKPRVIQKCFGDLLHLLEEGVIDPPSGGTFSIDQLAEAHELLEKGKTMGKLVVKW